MVGVEEGSGGEEGEVMAGGDKMVGHGGVGMEVLED